MPPQQHLYNGVARPADYCIFVPEWTRLPMGKFMLESQIVPWSSWLAYGQHKRETCLH